MDIRKKISSHSDRTNTIIRNVVFSTLIRGVNILVSLILVPLTINYVSAELYGIWLSLSSIVSWFSFFDIGFGLGMRNKLTTALALHKYKYGKILVSTTYAFMSLIFLIVGIVACIGCTLVDWEFLLNISPGYNDIVTKSFQIVIVAFCLRMVLQIVGNVCQAYQMTALAGFVDMMGNVIALVFVILLTITFAPDLILLSGALCFAPLIAFFVANIVLYQNKFLIVSPSINYVRRFVLKDITNLGVKFFLIQIICVVLYQTTNFIISHFCGPEQVTVYNIAYKYLNVAVFIFAVVQSPIWSAFNDAYALNDYKWMENIYRKLMLMMLSAEICLFLMVIVSPIAYRIWLGDSVIVPINVTILVAIYVGVQFINSMQAMILNGMGKIKLQTLLVWSQGLLYFPMVIMLAEKMHIEGILLALSLVTAIPTYMLSRQVYLLIHNKAHGIYLQ